MKASRDISGTKKTETVITTRALSGYLPVSHFHCKDRLRPVYHVRAKVGCISTVFQRCRRKFAPFPRGVCQQMPMALAGAYFSGTGMPSNKL